MTASMDNMYIKLDQKEEPYKPQIYQKRGRGQNRENFRQSNNWRGNRSFSRECGYNNNRGYGRGEVISEEVAFVEGLVVILEEMIVGTEIERIEGLGDSLDQEKEE